MIKKYLKKFSSFLSSTWEKSKSKKVSKWLRQNATHVIIGVITAAFAGGFILLDDPDWKNAFLGVTTGLVASLVVDITNECREKKRLKREKEVLSKNLRTASLLVYEDTIYRINWYIKRSDLKVKDVYAVYSDNKSFLEFIEHLKKIDFLTFPEKEKAGLDDLFHFNRLLQDFLASEIKAFPKSEYFLKGLLSEEEFKKSLSPLSIESYAKEAETLDEFWDKEIINLQRCIDFLGFSVIISSHIISLFEDTAEKAQDKEKKIKKAIADRYFKEVKSRSSEYIISCLENDLAEKEDLYSVPPEEAAEMAGNTSFNKDVSTD